ncbi:MAG: hypothetical protein ABIP54_04635 [Candidatus Andersenbacteria bacterium]
MNDKKLLEWDIRRVADDPDYKKSWEIVSQEGYENIIKKLHRRKFDF